MSNGPDCPEGAFRALVSSPSPYGSVPKQAQSLSFATSFFLTVRITSFQNIYIVNGMKQMDEIIGVLNGIISNYRQL